MATRLQLRRGTSTENNNFTGAEGELTYNSTTKGLRIHNGSTKGGYLVDTVVAFQAPTASNNYTWYRKYSSGWVEQGIHGNLSAANSFTQLDGHSGMEIQNAFNLPIKMATLASANAELSGSAQAYCGDVYINNGTEAKCWVFNASNISIDLSAVMIHITVAGMAA